MSIRDDALAAAQADLQKIQQGQIQQQAQAAAQADLERLGMAPPRVNPTDEHWLSRTAGRFGAEAMGAFANLADFLTFNQFETVDRASDYWKQKVIENPHDTGGIRESFAAGPSEFGKFIVENLGDSLGIMFPTLVSIPIGGGAGAAVGAARAGMLAETGLTAANATRLAAQAGARTGAMTAAVGTGAVQHGYETVDMLREEGLTPTAANVVPTALAKAWLDAFALGKMASGLGLGKFFGAHVVEEVGKRGLTGLAKNVGVAMGVEGITEALQEAIDVGVVAALKDESLWKAYPREMQRIVDAGLTGAVLGGTVAAAGGLMPQANSPADAIAAKANVKLVEQELAKQRIAQAKAAANDPTLPQIYEPIDIDQPEGATVPMYGVDEAPNPMAGVEVTPPPVEVVPTPLAPSPLYAGDLDPDIGTYAPFDYDGGVSRDAEIQAGMMADLDGKQTETATASFVSKANPAGGVDIFVTNKEGKSRRLFTAQIKVIGNDVTLTVPKMVGVQGNAVQHFIDTAVSAVRKNAPGTVRVNMPQGTGRLWGKIAEAYGAEVDVNGFSFRPKIGTIYHGNPVVAGGAELRPGIVVTTSAPKILSIKAFQVTKFEDELKRLTSLYAPDLKEGVAVHKAGGARAAQLMLTPTAGNRAGGGNPLASAALIDTAIAKRGTLVPKAVRAQIAANAMTGPGVQFAPFVVDQKQLNAGHKKAMGDYDAFIQKMQAQITAWHQKFTPDASVIVVPYYNALSDIGGTEATLQKSDGTLVGVISVNLASRLPTHLATESANQLTMMNALAHEYGHFLHDSFWHKAPQELITAVKTEFMAIKARAMKENEEAMVRERFPTHIAQLARTSKATGLLKDIKDKDDKAHYAYYLSDMELFAKGMAEILLEVEAKNPKSIISDYIRAWKVVIEDFLGVLGWPKAKDNKALKMFYKWLDNPNIVKARPSNPLAPPVKPVMTDMDGFPVLYEGGDTISEMLNVREDSAQSMYAARDLDIKGFWWMKKILSMPQLVDRFKVPALETYWNLVKKIKTLKMEVIGEADQMAQEFAKFRSRKPIITRALYALNDWSDAEQRRFTEEEIVQAFSGTHPTHKFGEKLEPAEIEFILKVQKNFSDVLGRMEYAQMVRAAFGVLPDINVDRFVHEWKAAATVLEQDAVLAKYTNNPATWIDNAGQIQSNPLAQAMRDISAKYAGMRERNYVPKMRHGQNVMRVVAVEDCLVDGQPFSAGETILFQGFDQESEMNSAAKEALASAEGMGIKVKIETDILKDTEFSAIGLPRAFIDALKDNESMEFTEEQKRKLEKMALEMSPSRSFLKQFLKRQNIDGYSEDFERTYSSYMFRAAGHIAKTQYDRQVNYAIREFDKQKDRNLAHGIANNSAWTELQNFVKEHFRYVMSADSDFSRVRSLMSAWYLGFMPRSALANLYQVPMATYPFLAGKYGDTAAVKAIAKAYTVTKKALDGGKLPLHIEVALKRAYAEQQIDASAIVELGAMGDSNWIDRHLWPSKLGTSQKFYTKWVIDRGFWLFRGAEKINRRTTFLAAFELEWEKSKDAELAYQEAVKALELTQFDMSKEARAEMFRGGKGILFMFNQHLMGMTYLAFGGFSANKRQWAIGVRLLAMSAVLAGTEGLPWAGLGMDLFDLISKLYKQLSGEEYTYSDVRADIRELYKSLGADPELWMRGMSRKFGLGPLSVATLFGAPEIDLSGSIGLGYPGSWAQMLKSTEGTSEERWAKTMESLGGPAYSILNGIWRAVTDNNPNTWKQVESGMPAFMRAVSQGARWIEQGGEHTNNGALIYGVNEDNQIDAAYRAMGLTPTKLAQLYSANGVVAEAAAYWGGRKSTLLAEYSYAKDSGDSDMIRIAQENIRRYNNAVRDNEVGKSFLISPKSLAVSYKRRRKAIERVEAGLSGNVAHQQLMEAALRLQQPGSNLLEQSNAARWGN